MNNEMKLPKEYSPYKKLNLCSNIATNYQVPIGSKTHNPLLIGTGDVPLIWIAVSNPDNSEDWRYLVSMNKSLHSKIKVEINSKNGSVIVKAGNDTLINVVSVTPNEAKVIAIDFTAIGLNIIGNEGFLNVGGQRLSGNSFSGVGTIIGLG